MSFFDDASLAFLPSGGAGKDTKAYSIKPTDGTGDFTFSRGSNLAATRVGPTGLIEKGRENLLLQSNNFGTSWTILNITQTSGQSGYDGTNDAWQSSFTAGSTRAFGQSFSQTGVITISIYVKAGTHDFIQFVTSTSTTAYVNFDISSSSAAVGTEGSGVIDSSITSVGGDWYRCSMSFNNTSSGTIYAWMIDSATSPRASVVSTAGTIYIQDAQLEIGLAATDYIESGATTGKAGLLEDEPRFDYSGGATCPSLLLEPSRTNSYASSEWILNLDADLSQEVSDVDSPIENTPFLKITKNTSGLARQLLYTSTNGDIDTCSVFAKKGSAGGNQILFADSFYGASTMSASFDLDTGSWFVPPSGTALVDYGFDDFGNGMYRIWVAGRTMDSANPDSTRWRTPALYFDDTQLAVGEHIYITGLQTERNCSYPTSYIPNHSGGSVTRGADVANDVSIPNTPSLWSCLVDVDLSKTPLVSNKTFFNTKTTSGTMSWRFFNRNGVYAVAPYFETSASYAFGNNEDNNRTDGRVLLRYNGSGSYTYFRSYLGVVTQTTATGLTETNLNQIKFNGNDTKWASSQILVFPTALSDADCITLTTL